MRKVIDSINQGQLDRKFGTLTFSTSSIEHTICAGDVCEGSFTVFAATHNLAEGIICTDDYRMECINETFSGMQDDIAYRFHAEEMSVGQEVKGNFIILSNRGEYTIPFTIRIEAESLSSSLGPIRNVFHFANLAKSNWKEAVQLFYNKNFADIFRESDREYLAMYKCLSGVYGSEINVDEFLVSIRKKTPVEYIASETQVEINNPVGVSRYGFNISRNGWGYTKLNIETEGDFLSVETKEIGADDFLGNNYLAYYYIDADRLHMGKNYGAVILKDSRITTRIEIVVNKESNELSFRNIAMARMKSIVQIMEYYQSYRLKKISARIWLAESNKIVEQMLASDHEDLLARLYQIHILLTQERINEANWNLKIVKPAAESVQNTQVYLWCYYLYLLTLSPDTPEEQVDACCREVVLCYEQNPADWRIAWLSAYMSESYKNMIRRWVIYEESYNNGCTSPLMYIEAARLMLDNPALLTKLDRFEIQLLRFIFKKGIMSEELVFVFRNLAERLKEYSETILNLLIECYRDNPHDELLTVIISQLIKGNRTDKAAFEWYGYGVKQELKITRLYEYYMLSLDMDKKVEIPRPVLMYYSFHSDLDYERNSYLYARVLDNKETDSDMYSRYKMQMMEFVSAQLEAGHNNNNLSKLYKNLIDEDFIENDEIAYKIADILFTREIDTSAYEDIKKVILCYGCCDGEQSFNVVAGKAEIPIYTDDYCIALEDERGNRYVMSKPVEAVELIAPGRLMLNIQHRFINHVGYDIHACMEHHGTFDIRMENEFRFRNLLDKKALSHEYSRNITMKLVRYYYDQDRIEDLDKFLDSLEADDVASFERAECIRYMIKRTQYVKAMDWIYRFGPEGIDTNTMANLVCSWLPVYRDDTGIYARLIVQLLFMTLSVSENNLLCMQYLSAHITGGIKTLRKVWESVKKCGTDSREIEEKMIIQFLYTRSYIHDRGEILKSYAFNTPDGDILRAALAEASFEFFVEEGIVSDNLFVVLTEAMESDIDLHLTCYLAYVKYFAENKNLIDDKVRPLLKDALHRLLSENIVLECFRSLADFMPSMAQFADSTIIEYRTKAGTNVSIHYIIEGDLDSEYIAEEMEEIYGGVYTKQFTIFFGEKLMYYITEENGDEKGFLSESHTIMNNDIDELSSQGRFGIVNDICIGRTLRDYVTVDSLLHEYYMKDYLSKKLFGMHKG